MGRRAAKQTERDAIIRLVLRPLLDRVQDETDKRRISEALKLLEPETVPSP
jgi:hypothetical protein